MTRSPSGTRCGSRQKASVTISNAGNDFRLGEQLCDRRHPRAPGGAGVKDDLGGVSSRNTGNSLRALIPRSKAPKSPASGPDIPASKCGFCHSNAASRVEPERGRPEVK